MRPRPRPCTIALRGRHPPSRAARRNSTVLGDLIAR